MLGMLSALSSVYMPAAVVVSQLPAESGTWLFAANTDKTTMTCAADGQVVIAKLVDDEIVLEIKGVQLSWLVRQKQEDGLYTFVALDAETQGYPLGFAMVSFEDQLMIFAPPEAGLQPKRQDLKLVQCK